MTYPRYGDKNKEDELREIAEEELSDEKTQKIFIKFMQKRFKEHAFDGHYAHEWGQRFAEGKWNNREWHAADGQSRKVLLELNPEKYKGLE